MDKKIGRCASCRSKYSYTEEYRKARGNYCRECCSKIENIQRLRILMARRDKTLKVLDEIDQIKSFLLRNWNIELEKYDKERNIQEALMFITE